MVSGPQGQKDTRGTHYVLKPIRTNDVTTFFFFFFFYITSWTKFVIIVTKILTSFCTTIFIPCDKMSGKGDGSSVSSFGFS